MTTPSGSTVPRVIPVLLAAVITAAAAGCESAAASRSFSWQGGTPEKRIAEQAPPPPSAKTLFSMTRILVAQGKESEAYYVLGRLITEHPDFIPAYVEMGEWYIRHSRTDDAIAVLTTALESHPQDPVLLNNLGMCHVLRRDFAQALERFEQARLTSPTDARVGGNIAMCLGMLGRYDEAIDQYRSILPPADAYHNLGVLCMARNDSQSADHFFKLEMKLRGRTVYE